jgi:hypothetical protein
MEMAAMYIAGLESAVFVIALASLARGALGHESPGLGRGLALVVRAEGALGEDHAVAFSMKRA